MEVLIAVAILIWLPMTFVCSWVASEKNRSGLGHWVASLLFSPAFWILVLIALPTLVPRQIALERTDPTLSF
jgi:hypothetical protein